MNNKLIVPVVIALAIGLVLGWLVKPTATRYGGTTGLDSLALKGDLSVDGNTTLTGTLTPAGVVSTTAAVKAKTLAVGAVGTATTKMYSASSSLDFAAIGAGACSSSARTVTGVGTDDALIVSWPNSVAALTSTTKMAWVSAANTVTLKICNYGTATTADPAAGVFRYQYFRFY